ncbi:uncharacterized protein [Amphiura filiformis]|uniref:uncharacterized protein n=1 Tax=Amphiura filiformis TaxID=82378 RepID=UPI003B222DDC
MVFKAAAGVTSPDPYHLWVSTQHDASLPYSTRCQLDVGTQSTHCKTYGILNWDKLNISEVKISLYSSLDANDKEIISKVFNVTFNALNTTSVGWMTRSRLMFHDIDDAVSFSIDGYIDGVQTGNRFSIYESYFVDECYGGGWLAMIVNKDECDWLDEYNEYLPVFLYSSEENGAYLYYSATASRADIFALHVKTQIGMPTGHFPVA